jgi:hypothetical protein
VWKMEYRQPHLPTEKLIASVPNTNCVELVMDVMQGGAFDNYTVEETLEAAQKIDQDGVCAIKADAERIFQEDALFTLMLPDEEVDKGVMTEKKRRVDEDIAKILEGDLIKRLDTFRQSKVGDDIGRCEALAGLGIQLKRLMVRMDAMKDPAKAPLRLARRAFVSSLGLNHVSARSEDRYACYGVMNCACQNLLEVACAMGGCLDGKEEVALCVAFYLLSTFQVECYEMMQRELDTVQQQVSNRYTACIGTSQVSGVCAGSYPGSNRHVTVLHRKHAHFKSHRTRYAYIRSSHDHFNGKSRKGAHQVRIRKDGTAAAGGGSRKGRGRSCKTEGRNRTVRDVHGRYNHQVRWKTEKEETSK